MLIAEDEPDIAQIVEHALERTGDLPVDIVGTGDAARVRRAVLPPREPEAGGLARSAAGAGLGLRAEHRHAGTLKLPS